MDAGPALLRAILLEPEAVDRRLGKTWNFPKEAAFLGCEMPGVFNRISGPERGLVPLDGSYTTDLTGGAVMSGNTMARFWARQSNYDPLTPAQLEAIRAAFGVTGELRPTADAPGYAVSDDGRVFSGVLCSWRKDCPRELRPARNGAGYLMARLHVDKKAIGEGIHRLVARAFLPPPHPGQTVVRHLDGNSANNRAENLAWGTQADNVADAVAHGRTLKGLRNPNVRLNDRLVVAIRILHREGYSAAAIASFLGVAPRTIERACAGEQWRHVEETG